MNQTSTRYCAPSTSSTSLTIRSWVRLPMSSAIPPSWTSCSDPSHLRMKPIKLRNGTKPNIMSKISAQACSIELCIQKLKSREKDLNCHQRTIWYQRILISCQRTKNSQTSQSFWSSGMILISGTRRTTNLIDQNQRLTWRFTQTIASWVIHLNQESLWISGRTSKMNTCENLTTWRTVQIFPLISHPCMTISISHGVASTTRCLPTLRRASPDFSAWSMILKHQNNFQRSLSKWRRSWWQIGRTSITSSHISRPLPSLKTWWSTWQ